MDQGAPIARPGPDSRLALVMGGGGARGAYQAGVLRYLARELGVTGFPLITGVSAGAINAVHLANHRGTLVEATEDLVALWSSISVDRVFRTSITAMARGVFRWGFRLLAAGHGISPRARGLVDTAPLREFLCESLDTPDGHLPGIRMNILERRLRAVAVTAIDYGTGRSTTWVEGRGVRLWTRPLRRAYSAHLTVDHVMASTALPLFFPAVQVEGSWFGDGGVRHTTPLSPAIYMGADRILAISARYPRTVKESEEPAIAGYPPPAQILGVMLNSILIDNLDFDGRQVERLNELLAELPEGQRHGLRRTQVYTIRPSKDLGKLAGEFEPKLPGTFRHLSRGLGTRETRSPDFLSYLMFQSDYIHELVTLGEHDAAARSDELREFLHGGGDDESAASTSSG